MSTSKLVDTRFAKWLVIVNGLVPMAILGWDAFHHQLGADEVNFAILTTGIIGLVLLIASLAITPLRKLTGWAPLIGVRRNLGVLGFTYICTHFAIFFWFDRNHDVGDTLSEIVKREYLWYGFGALVLMAPLAITSLDSMVSRLGAKRWKLLHRLNYLIVPAGVYHFYLERKSDKALPELLAGIVTVLLAYRLVAHYLELRRKANVKLPPPPKKKTFWKGELVIARIFDETHDVKTFRFVNPDGGPLPFEHIAGQYINLHLNIGDKRVNRSYTIASSPTRGAYCEISVKKAANGYGSKHLHETFREGQRVKVSAPAGKFYFAGHESERVVLVAGGIGITPMMSVIRSLTDRGWKGDIYLFYSVRTPTDVAFKEELEYLQKRYANLHVDVVISTERGHITKEIVEKALPGLNKGPIMLCGPDPMMTAMRKLFVDLGVPDAEIHQEAFISTPPIDASAPVDEPLEPGQLANIRFHRAGKTAEQTELTVLEAAEECGVALPFECRSGICGQCKTRLVSGKVVMEVQDALTNQDRVKGLILACQARATRDLVIDA